MYMRLKPITAFLLILTMAVSGSYVFAGTDAEPSDEGQEVVIDVTDETAPPDDATAPNDAAVPDDVVFPGDAVAPSDLSAPKVEISDQTILSEPNAPLKVEGEEGSVSPMALEADNSITAVTWNYKPASVPNPDVFHYAASPSGECSIIRVNVKTSGKLWLIAAVGENTLAPAKVFVGKYNPDNGDVNYSYTVTVTLSAIDEAVPGIGGIDVVSGGSYCIGIESEQAGDIAVLPYVFSYATRTLPVGKLMWTEGYKTSSAGKLVDSKALYKIKPSKTGYIVVSAAEFGRSTTAGYITLLNSKKKAISDKLTYNDSNKAKYVAFGVKKGVTYYLQATGFQGVADENYCYGIQYKNYAAALRANTSKKKSTTLKRKAKYITAAMPATGTSGSQWYKFKVTKKRATRISIDATYIKSGKTAVTVYRGKKRVGKTTLKNGKVNNLSVTYSSKKGVAKKGTYYVKVTKSAKANGRYRIRYVK